MQDLKRLGITELLDLLIEQTTRYLRIRIYGGSKDQFDKCQLLMTQIQREIKLRKAGNNPLASSSGNSFSSGDAIQKYRQKNSD